MCVCISVCKCVHVCTISCYLLLITLFVSLICVQGKSVSVKVFSVSGFITSLAVLEMVMEGKS